MYERSAVIVMVRIAMGSDSRFCIRVQRRGLFELGRGTVGRQGDDDAEARPMQSRPPMQGETANSIGEAVAWPSPTS